MQVLTHRMLKKNIMPPLPTPLITLTKAKKLDDSFARLPRATNKVALAG